MFSTPSGATQKADQIFLPVLENAAKTDKARATLGVFERSKFLFNLPGFLRESVAQVGPTLPHRQPPLTHAYRESMMSLFEITRKENTYTNHDLPSFFLPLYPKKAANAPPCSNTVGSWKRFGSKWKG